MFAPFIKPTMEAEMQKFSKPFLGCRDGDVYPTQFHAGDDCPPELLLAAEASGVLAEQSKAINAAPENKRAGRGK